MESPVTMLPSSAQSVRADNVRIPLVSFSFMVLFSPAPRPMDFLAPMICPALRIKLGIIRSTITSSITGSSSTRLELIPNRVAL